MEKRNPFRFTLSETCCNMEVHLWILSFADLSRQSNQGLLRQGIHQAGNIRSKSISIHCCRTAVLRMCRFQGKEVVLHHLARGFHGQDIVILGHLILEVRIHPIHAAHLWPCFINVAQVFLRQMTACAIAAIKALELGDVTDQTATQTTTIALESRQ